MPPNIFAVCPHDTARGFDKWALFNTVANRNLGLGGRFEAYLDFATFGRDLAEGRFLWAYVNPADYVKLHETQGYIAVARPTGRYDVAHVITYGNNPVSSISPSSRIAVVAGYLGRVVSSSLRQRVQGYVEVPAKSYNDVMTILRRGEADFGITYNEHFGGLSPASREGFQISESVDAGLTHVVVAHPELSVVSRAALASWLKATEQAPDVERAWKALDLQGFEDVPEAPFEQLRSILESK
jgi:hypothetical protein